MANADKNIVITPNVGAASQPSIVFTGFNAVPVTLKVTDDGSLSFEASAGQLFSITNNLVGTVFSVNDVGGYPLMEITDTPAIVTYAPITGVAGLNILDDVSQQCDADRCVFELRQNSTSLSFSTVIDSKDLEVSINGIRLEPYIGQNAFAFLPTYDSFKGFRVRENRLIIYNAPEINSKVTVNLRKVSTSKQIRRYPFSATTIGLGD